MISKIEFDGLMALDSIEAYLNSLEDGFNFDLDKGDWSQRCPVAMLLKSKFPNVPIGVTEEQIQIDLSYFSCPKHLTQLIGCIDNLQYVTKEDCLQLIEAMRGEESTYETENPITDGVLVIDWNKPVNLYGDLIDTLKSITAHVSKN